MKAFMEPEIEVKKFSVEDVITTSGGPDLDEDETKRLISIHRPGRICVRGFSRSEPNYPPGVF